MATKDTDECLIAEDEWETSVCTSGRGDSTRSVGARHWARWNGSLWHVVAEPKDEAHVVAELKDEAHVVAEPKETRRREIGPCAGPVPVSRTAGAWTVLRDEDGKE